MDHERRVHLVQRLEGVWNVAGSIAHGAPMVTVLDAKANQSQKPNPVLSRVGMEPVAALHWYEVISHATPPRVQALADLVAGSTDATVLKALSAVEDFRVWTPVPDALVNAQEIKDLRGTGTTLRAEFFGWMAVDMAWQTRDTESPSLAHYLADIGFPVRSTAGTPGRPVLYLDVLDGCDISRLGEVVGLRKIAPSPTYTPSATYSVSGEVRS